MRLSFALVCLSLTACTVSAAPCADTSLRCDGSRALRCGALVEDCASTGVCIADLGCRACVPDRLDCDGDRAVRCASDGSAFTTVATCDVDAGEICVAGGCVSACDAARASAGYEGCEFLAVDLDNYRGDQGDAAGQPWGIAVSNPGAHPAHVVVELDDSAPGAPAAPRVIAEATVPPGDLEPIAMPTRELDGDGAHTAITRGAFRVRSTQPVVAYQFNPVANVGAFSDDASLLLPVHALATEYTAIGWPQTLGGEEDFEPQIARSFLTIAAPGERAHVRVTLPEGVAFAHGGVTFTDERTIEVELGPLDVLNLETARRGADPSGAHIESDAPVAVWTGSECADVPSPDAGLGRLCCCDHLEEQLLPDRALGRSFAVPLFPSRSRALVRALVDPEAAGLPESDDPQWIRVMAVSDGETEVLTSLAGDDARFTLARGQVRTLLARTDVTIEASAPLSVLLALASQEAVGIPAGYPGGDPSLVVVPPLDQLRARTVFLTPDRYAFDFVTIVAPPEAGITLDGAPLPTERCATRPADGRVRASSEPPAELLVHACQLSEPDVLGEGDGQVMPGTQRDGVHEVLSTRPVLVLVSGFDRHVGYAYPAGLDLHPID